MIIEGKTGPQSARSSLGPNTPNVLRQGNMGEMIISELHGRYYEAAYQKTLFNGAITGQVTTVGLATTYTGLCLSNPIGSPVNLSLIRAKWAFLVAFPAAASIGLMTGYNSSTNVTHTTPVTPRSQLIGSPANCVGLLDSAATLPTAPTLNTILGSGLTGAITTVPHIACANEEMAGEIVIPAGGYVAFYTSTVSGAAGGAFSFSWEEVPI